MSASHLRGLGDSSQLQVLRVSPAEQLAISGHGQAAVSVRADLLDLHPGQIPPDLHGAGAHALMSQTCKTREMAITNQSLNQLSLYAVTTKNLI